MCDKGVGNADMAHLANNACVGEELGDAAPRTTSYGVFLQSDQQIMLFNQRENHCLIQRFHPAHVDHRCAQCFGGSQRLIQQYAKIQDGDAGPFSHQLGFADLHRGESSLDRDASAFPARVADRRGSVMEPRALQHLPALIFIAGCTNHHIGDAAQIRQVEGAMMRGPVLTHEARPINSQSDVEALQGHIMYELIVAALQKGGVNGEHRLESIAGHTRSQRHRVLLGNRYIIEALGKRLGILHHA